MRSEWDLLGRLGLALVPSTAIGLEREWRQKCARLRTYTLVGLGSALLLLVGEYGLFDELQPGRVVPDPPRVAAQIVSGIGFTGGGLIFVRQDAVRGVLSRVTGAGFAVSRGRAPVTGLVTELGTLDGVLLVNATDADPD